MKGKNTYAFLKIIINKFNKPFTVTQGFKYAAKEFSFPGIYVGNLI